MKLSKIKLASIFWLKTRSWNLAWELAEIKLFAGSIETLVTDKVALINTVNAVELGAEKEIKLKHRYLLTLVNREENSEFVDHYLRYRAVSGRSYLPRRLTVAVKEGCCDFVNSIPLLPIALIVLILIYPVSLLLQRKLGISKEHSYEAYAGWLNVFFGYLKEGPGYKHYWFFGGKGYRNVNESFTTLRVMLTAVPYPHRKRFITTYRKALSSHLWLQRYDRK